MATIGRLEGYFGAEIRGIDVAGGVDEAAMRLLTETLYEHRVVVIRDQHLSEEGYLGFGRQWGAPIPHVLDHMRMPGYPELLTVGNTEERDRESLIRNGAALWHTDQSYETVPATATMLYSILAPRHGGETQFCNMVAAYDALDAETQGRLNGLQMAHKYGRGRNRSDEPPVNPITNAEQDVQVPVTYHPLVMPHPITGRKALYALGHGAHGILGMPDDEADTLIESLKSHVAQEQFIYRHRYAVGDLAIWDTLSTMHRATPIEFTTGENDARLLWRISCRGKPFIYSTAA